MFARQSEMVTSEKLILAYWLLPSEPARSYFVSLISNLAGQFGAPVFEPHLTIYATRKGNEKADEVLHRVSSRCRPLRLSVRGLDHSEEFTKTVFVQFEPNNGLTRLSGALQRASAFPDSYQLNPHLSLIYKTMSRETKEKIADSISLPFDEVLFDSANAVISPAEIKSRADVEAWLVVATQRLTE